MASNKKYTFDPSEWEEISAPSSNKSSSKFNPEEWEEFTEEPNETASEESLGHAALMALPRIGSDLLSKGYEGAQKIPEYWQKYKTELPGFWQNLFNHPGSMAKQGFAGLNEAVNAINQAPLGLAQYANKRLNLVPESVPNAIKNIIPEDTTEAINYLFGQPEHTGEALLRGTVRHLPELVGIGKGINELPHLTKRGALKKLKKGKKLASEREIGKLDVDPELIEDARQFLPDVLQNRTGLNASHLGDYNSLFDLQSKLGKISQARMGKIRSLFAPESAIKGEAGLGSRNNLLNAIHENLQSQGHLDISDLLREGQRDYRRYMNFRKYPRLLAGAAAVHSAPKNALTDLIKQLWHA